MPDRPEHTYVPPTGGTPSRAPNQTGSGMTRQAELISHGRIMWKPTSAGTGASCERSTEIPASGIPEQPAPLGLGERASPLRQADLAPLARRKGDLTKAFEKGASCGLTNIPSAVHWAKADSQAMTGLSRLANCACRSARIPTANPV